MDIKRILQNLPADMLLHILNELNIQIMITDPYTDEVIFANKKMNESYHVDIDPIGKKCWEVFPPDMKERCPFCQIPKLLENPDEVIEWEEHNEFSGRWFLNIESLIDWKDGKKVHFEQIIDITDKKKIENNLTRQLGEQGLLSHLSQSFVSVADIDTLINNALKIIGENMWMDRVVLVRIEEKEQRLFYDYQWQSAKLSELERKFSLQADIGMDPRVAEARSLSSIACSDIGDDSRYEVFKQKGLKAFLSVPVVVEGNVWGVLLLEMFTALRDWTEDDVSLARMISNVIGGAISRALVQKAFTDASESALMMVDASPLACAIFDEDMNVIACNEQAASLHGLSSKEEYIGSLSSIMPEYQPDGTKSHEKVVETLKAAFISGYEIFEFSHVHRDGSSIPVEVTLVRVLWRGKTHIAGYVRDLRQLKASQAEINKAQEELLHALARAEDSAKAKTNFLANMSHEIRTPMNAIIGMTDIAKVSSDMVRIKYCLGKVDDAANHLLGVINDILDMSKIEAGKFDITFSDFLLEKMLERVSNVTNFRAEQKHQDFVIKVDRDVPVAIISDQQRLAQVITNLLSNAVKFTPEFGRVGLYIHNIENRKEDCTLLFEVIDSGIGVTDEQKTKLFRSFEQADGSISRRFGGTGLGLAISKNIVNLLGGDIGFESEYGKGSRFFFTMDVKKGKAGYASKLNPEIDWKKVNVLVVDDSEDVLEYFTNIADILQVSCDTASNGFDACKLIESGGNYNILFVDWMMPEMDGIELTRKIRQAYGGNVIVIMISAAEWKHIEESARGVGIDRFLPKPLLPSAIIDCINECLGAQNAVKTVEDIRRQDDEGIFAGKRILLAEDIEINREILINILSDTGIVVDCAENGAEACNMFENAPARYDLILMDIHMPEVDGYQATRSIRSMCVDHAQRVPIIAMTANVFKEDIERCIAAGMNDHIGKPIDIDDVISKLRKYIEY